MPIRLYHRSFSSYSLKESSVIGELGIVAKLLQHDTSGANVLHLQGKSDDPMKTFSIGFHTPPTTSNGAPHVLEHLVLCGSKSFPVRDPFFKMLNRSLASYMNAWTAADWTMYPFSTPHWQDFCHLRSIYTDAVFAPLLRRADFEQEGWRMEHGKNGYGLSGVVYNEMKGAFSDSDTIFHHLLHCKLFPSTPYALVSGGDPQDIPSLSHEELIRFWKFHYRPSNSLNVIYGNLNESQLNEHLLYMSDIYHGQKDNVQGNNSGNSNNSLSFMGPQRVEEWAGAPDPLLDNDRQSRLIISHLTNSINDLDTSFAMKILSTLLMEGPSAPLYKALFLDNHYGSDYVGESGYDALSTPIATFSIGLQGIKASDIPTIEQTIYSTLQKVHQEGVGLEADRIECILHQMEISLKYHSANFGLGLAQKATTAWSKGITPLLETLQINKRISNFRNGLKLAGSPLAFFGPLLEKYILSNEAGRLTFIMHPDSEHLEKQTKKEAKLIEELRKELTAEQENNIKKRAIEEQDANKVKQEDECNLLPCLALSDISPKSPPNPFTQIRNETIFKRTSEKCNGLGYYRAKLAIPPNLLTEEEIKLLPLWCAAVTEMGVEGWSRDYFDRLVKSTCGGLSVNIHLERPTNGNECPVALLVDTWALGAKVKDTLSLLKKTIHNTNWSDEAQLQTISSSFLSSLTGGISSNGHGYAKLTAAAPLSPQGRLAEQLNGIGQIEFLSSFLSSDNHQRQIAEKLRSISRKIVDSSSATFALIADSPDHLEKLIEANDSNGIFISKESGDKPTKEAQSDNKSVTFPRRALITTFNTSHVAQVFRINKNTYDMDPLLVDTCLSLLSRMLPPKYIHGEVRERGGAYGGGSSYSSLYGNRNGGLFTLYSYRDPQPHRTVTLFDTLHEWLSTNSSNFTEQDLLEAKLSLFSDLDAPRDLANEGMSTFLNGLGDADRQLRRDSLLNVDLDTILKVGRHVLGSVGRSTCVLVAPGHQDALQSIGFELSPLKL